MSELTILVELENGAARRIAFDLSDDPRADRDDVMRAVRAQIGDLLGVEESPSPSDGIEKLEGALADRRAYLATLQSGRMVVQARR